MSASMRATPRRLCVTPSKQVEEGEMESGRAANPSDQLVCTQDAAASSHCQRRPAHTLPQAHLRLGEDGKIPPPSLLLPHFPLSQTRGWSPTAHLIAFTLSCKCIC